MNSELCKRLVSPTDGSALRAGKDALVDASGRMFPVVNGIPRFVDAQNYAESFGVQWNTFEKTQLDSYTGLPLSEERLARCLRGELANVNGKRVLEAGSGAGRFTEILLKYGAVLDSFDYSAAVEANARNNGAAPDLTIVQADVRKPPFRRQSYDYVICLGVVQHTPSPEETIAALFDMVKPGGALIFDHYGKRLGYYTVAEPVYRAVLKRLPLKIKRRVTDGVVDFFFPIHWILRDNRFAQQVLCRVSPVHFYYPGLPLPNRETYLQWARLDTHDATTDHFKHRRTVREIRKTLASVGAIDIDVSFEGKRGNGVEAFCRRA